MSFGGIAASLNSYKTSDTKVNINLWSKPFIYHLALKFGLPLEFARGGDAHKIYLQKILLEVALTNALQSSSQYQAIAEEEK